MNENNNFKSKIIEEQTQTIRRHLQQTHSQSQRKPSLLNKTYFHNEMLQNPPENDVKNKTNDNFDENLSLINRLSNKSHFINPQDFKIIPDIRDKGKTFTMKQKLMPFNPKNKKVFSNFMPKKKDFYLTASINPLIKKREMKKCNSSENLNLNISNYKNNNIIDLIHEKEIQLCIDLIKTLPENKIKNIKNKNKGNSDFKNEETDNLIKLLKTFNINNVYTQRIIEDRILNKTIFNSEFNPLSTLNLSISTNYKTNNFPLNQIYKFNVSNFSNNKNFNNSSFSQKNNSSLVKNINESNSLNNNNSNSNNNELKKNINIGARSKLLKSISNKINNNSIIKGGHSIYSKNVYEPKNEINFHTGFVRAQKNIYDDVYSKYFKNKNRKRNEIKAKNFRKKLKEANKLSLPEIEEYKSIIKEIENRKNITLRKSKSVFDINMEKGDIVLKDQLIEELNNIYEGQKSTFLNSLKENFGDNEKIQIDLHKKEINENIRNINKIKRKQNSFVDGYSLFDGKINKQLKEYNYILGNRFHNRKQKEEKAEKLHEIYEEFENKINSYKKEILNQTNIYKQIYIPKFDIQKEENQNVNEIKIDENNYQYHKLNGNIILASRNDKIKQPKILSQNIYNKKEKIYNEYIDFRNKYNKKYLKD